MTAAERLVSEASDHGVTHGLSQPATTAPPVRFDDPIREHGSTGLEALAQNLSPNSSRRLAWVRRAYDLYALNCEEPPK
jgi:hypothetical protein